MINNILVIGGPNAGKTHFGGQLYGRLNSRKFNYRIDPQNRPADLTIFEDVLNKLSEGRRADHTQASANKNIELIIDDNHGNKIAFAFPDYAGEQVKMMVENRRINKIWKEYVDQSTSWILFVRLNEILAIEDIINRGIPSPQEIMDRNAQPPPVKISDPAYFIELLQMLLYLKGVSTLRRIVTPRLTIVLSCWDLLNLQESTTPSIVLKDRLPLLYQYLINSWNSQSLSILGLSSTEKTLTDDPDDEFIDKTPINFGYIINTEGVKEKDLTISIAKFI